MTEIYYFSGTGNSFYVAKVLQKQIEDSRLIPIVSLLKQKTIEINGESVGIVFPLHGLNLPIPVRMFLKKVKFKSTNYIFAITTRAGSKSFAFRKIDKLLKRHHKQINSNFILTMLNNDPKLKDYEDPTPEVISKMKSDIDNRIKFISEKISKKENYKENESEGATFPYNKPVTYLLERLILLATNIIEFTNINNYFYSDSKCIGCGICERVCLSDKIKMVDKRPIWQNKTKCYMCYTCLNYCPEKAIQIKSKIYMKSYTNEKGRYPHPFATIKGISEQKP